MIKYKLNKNLSGQVPTDADIEASKDFARLHANYDKVTKRPKVPLYKNPIAFFILVIIIIILLLLTGDL
jgi:hypothetical protein